MIPAIGAFDVIEHIKDDDKFIKDIYNILKRDGVFYVTVPAFQFLWSHYDIDSGHYRRYTRKSNVNSLEKNNFEVIYSTYFFLF